MYGKTEHAGKRKKMFSALFHRRPLPALAASCVPRRRKPIAERRRWLGSAHSPAASLCPSPHGGWLHSEDPAICLLQIEDLGCGMRVTPKVSSLRIKCVRCAYFASRGRPKARNCSRTGTDGLSAAVLHSRTKSSMALIGTGRFAAILGPALQYLGCASWALEEGAVGAIFRQGRRDGLNDSRAFLRMVGAH